MRAEGGQQHRGEGACLSVSSSLLALTIPGVIGGAIITETVFRINGIGQLLITSIRNGDVPMVQTITFFSAFLVVLFNLIADALYGLLDPRIRYE